MKWILFSILVITSFSFISLAEAQVYSFQVDMLCPDYLLGPYYDFSETREWIHICPINTLGFAPPPEEKMCKPITSLIVTGSEKVGLGETKENAQLKVEWTGNSKLIIQEVMVDEQTGFQIKFQYPIIFEPDPSGETISYIPYTIEAPLTACVDEQTPRCIYPDSLYTIPVTIIGNNCDDTFEINTDLEINNPDVIEFPLFELIVIAIILLLIFVFIVGRRRRRDNRKRVLRHRQVSVQ